MAEVTSSVLRRETKIPPYTMCHYGLDLRHDEPYLYWRTIGLQEAITSRSIAEYERFGVIPEGFMAQPGIKSLKVIEIAPGLAEFLPTFAKSASVRPVAVDVIDYDEVANFLEQSLPRCNPDQRKEIEVMIDRARTITKLVDYIRCPVELLEGNHPELKGRFDMVVYHEGVMYLNETAKGVKSWLLSKPKAKQKIF